MKAVVFIALWIVFVFAYPQHAKQVAKSEARRCERALERSNQLRFKSDAAQWCKRYEAKWRTKVDASTLEIAKQIDAELDHSIP